MRKVMLPLIAVGSMALSGCWIHGHHSDPFGGGDGRRGASYKVVDAKQPPATLMAVDRTTCLVTAERYRNTRVGDTVLCNWRGGEPTLGLPVHTTRSGRSDPVRLPGAGPGATRQPDVPR